MAGWLHGASVDPTGEQIPAQIELTKTLAASADPAMVICLAGYAHDRPNTAQDAFAFIEEHATELDDGWSGQQGSLLTRRVAAAALIEILESQKETAATVCALALGAADFDGFKPPLGELPPLAKRALIDLADDARNVPELPAMTLRTRLDAEFKNLPAQDAEAVTNQQLREFLGETRAAVRALAELAELRQQVLQLQSRRTSEEIDLLWWVLEPFSDSLTGAWADAGTAATLAIGTEIARRLTVAPPPRGASGFVASALGKAGVTTDQPTTLAAVIDSAPEALLEDQLIAGDELCWSRPVLSALRARRASPEGQWTDSFAASVGASADLSASAATFALQLIRDVSIEGLLSA